MKMKWQDVLVWSISIGLLVLVFVLILTGCSISLSPELYDPPYYTGPAYPNYTYSYTYPYSYSYYSYSYYHYRHHPSTHRHHK